MKGMSNQTKSLITQTKAICTYKRINGIEEIAFIKGGNMYGIRRPSRKFARSKQKHLDDNTIDRNANGNTTQNKVCDLNKDQLGYLLDYPKFLPLYVQSEDLCVQTESLCSQTEDLCNPLEHIDWKVLLMRVHSCIQINECTIVFYVFIYQEY